MKLSASKNVKNWNKCLKKRRVEANKQNFE